MQFYKHLNIKSEKSQKINLNFIGAVVLFAVSNEINSLMQLKIVFFLFVLYSFNKLQR